MTRPYSQRAGRPDRLVVIDCETIAPPMADDKFPLWPLHSIIVTSLLSASRERYGQWQFELETVDFLSDPAKAIERVSYLLEGRTIVGFNSAGFDVPLLAITAMKHQRSDLVGISQAWQSHRYSGNSFDVADVMSGYGAARGGNLERLCGALGIPAKLDCHGDQVAELLAQQQHKKTPNIARRIVVRPYTCSRWLRDCDRATPVTRLRSSASAPVGSPTLG